MTGRKAIKWIPGDIIRQKQTGQAYIVVSTHYKVGTIMADITQQHPIPMMLFERDYDDFSRDCDMVQEQDEWKYKPFESL